MNAAEAGPRWRLCVSRNGSSMRFSRKHVQAALDSVEAGSRATQSSRKTKKGAIGANGPRNSGERT